MRTFNGKTAQAERAHRRDRAFFSVLPPVKDGRVFTLPCCVYKVKLETNCGLLIHKQRKKTYRHIYMLLLPMRDDNNICWSNSSRMQIRKTRAEKNRDAKSPVTIIPLLPTPIAVGSSNQILHFFRSSSPKHFRFANSSSRIVYI